MLSRREPERNPWLAVACLLFLLAWTPFTYDMLWVRGYAFDVGVTVARAVNLAVVAACWCRSGLKWWKSAIITSSLIWAGMVYVAEYYDNESNSSHGPFYQRNEWEFGSYLLVTYVVATIASVVTVAVCMNQVNRRQT
jgi:hypothetical protein